MFELIQVQFLVTSERIILSFNLHIMSLKSMSLKSKSLKSILYNILRYAYLIALTSPAPLLPSDISIPPL